MNTFNRGVMILTALTLLFALPICLTIFLVYPSDTLAYAKSWSTYLQGWFNPTTYMWTIILGIAFGLLTELFLLLLLLAEALPRRKKTIKVQMVEGGEARLHVESIIQRLRYEVDRLPDITDVRAKVQSKGGKGIDVHLEVKTSPTVSIPNKTEELMALIREQVENRMGIRLNKVTVDIKHSPYAKSEYRPAPPTV
ncbi:MAG: alkaline shock response membrane anchor protein AmaP [Chloroflexi bacterium]|nr:alkaline shock response membrane anchor protein AmaP [Chloroflexota bacterium]